MLALAKDSKLLIKRYPNCTEEEKIALNIAVKNSQCRIYNGAKNAYKLMESNKLILHNQLATSFLESIGMNIPTICFYDKEAYYFSKDFLPYAEEFKRLKIFISSIKKFEEHYWEIIKNPNNWWDTNEVQSVVKSFNNDFFKINKDWRLQWGKTLYNIVKA